MTHQEHEHVMEAVTEAVLEDVTLRTLVASAQLTFAANMIRRSVARKLSVTTPVPPRPAA